MSTCQIDCFNTFGVTALLMVFFVAENLPKLYIFYDDESFNRSLEHCTETFSGCVINLLCTLPACLPVPPING